MIRRVGSGGRRPLAIAERSTAAGRNAQNYIRDYSSWVALGLLGFREELNGRGDAMPKVRFVHFPPRIVDAKLMRWEPGLVSVSRRHGDLCQRNV